MLSTYETHIEWPRLNEHTIVFPIVLSVDNLSEWWHGPKSKFLLTEALAKTQQRLEGLDPLYYSYRFDVSPGFQPFERMNLCYKDSADAEKVLQLLSLPSKPKFDGKTLLNSRVWIWRTRIAIPGLYCKLYLRRYQGDHPFERSLIEKGWCPNQVAYCIATFGVETTAWSGNLQLHNKRSHSWCSREECVAFMVPDDSLVTKHVIEGCSCIYAAAPVKPVATLVTMGKIPLVNLKTENGQVKVEISEWKPGHDFVAFSHVWSHGLGNTLNNSLPVCQLQRIQSFAGKRNGVPQYFWLDTLCMPREPLNLRQIAIRGISNVYTKARRTIALDEELTTHRANGLCSVEILMRINLSSWMRRAWTLHEAVKSRKLLFQFSDGVYDISKALRMVRRLDPKKASESTSFQFHFLRAVSPFIDISLLRNETDELMRLARLWRLLRWRYLSKPKYETIYMGYLLGLEDHLIDLIIRTPAERRMLQFLKLLTVLPAQILFLQSPRMKDQSFRWAPKTWLHCHNLVEEQLWLSCCQAFPATRTDDGLILECSFISLGKSGLTLTQRLDRNLKISVLIRATDYQRFQDTLSNVNLGSDLLICLENTQQPLWHRKELTRGILVERNLTQEGHAEKPSLCKFICCLFVTPILGFRIKRPHDMCYFDLQIDTLSDKGLFCIG